MRRYLTQKQHILVRGVLQRDGHILIARDRDGSASLEYYELPGGYVAFGKDPIEALIDLFFEQTRIPVEVGEPVRTTSRLSPHDDAHTIEIVYRVRPRESVSEQLLHETVLWIETNDPGYFLSSRISETIRRSLE